jgi:hypothetical protein
MLLTSSAVSATELVTELMIEAGLRVPEKRELLLVLHRSRSLYHWMLVSLLFFLQVGANCLVTRSEFLISRRSTAVTTLVALSSSASPILAMASAVASAASTSAGDGREVARGRERILKV